MISVSIRWTMPREEAREGAWGVRSAIEGFVHHPTGIRESNFIRQFIPDWNEQFPDEAMMLQLHQLEVEGTAAGPLKKRLASLRSTRPRLVLAHIQYHMGLDESRPGQPSNQEPATMADELKQIENLLLIMVALLTVLRSGGKHETKRTGTQPVFWSIWR